MSSLENLSSKQLLFEEQTLILPNFNISYAIEIGDIAKELGIMRGLPIAFELRLGSWVVYHISLPGSNPENNLWIKRKANVVLLKHHSTLFERINSEERLINWFEENNLSEEDYAIHGGGIPLITKSDGLVGTLVISGLPQMDDHIFGVEVLTEFLTRKGELL